MLSYKETLILSYFNTVKAGYSYNELSDIFGLSLNQIDEMINQLNEKKVLELKEYYKITSIGKEILREENLENFDKLMEFVDESIFVNEPMSFTEVYIPKDFTKKLK